MYSARNAVCSMRVAIRLSVSGGPLGGPGLSDHPRREARRHCAPAGGGGIDLPPGRRAVGPPHAGREVHHQGGGPIGGYAPPSAIARTEDSE